MRVLILTDAFFASRERSMLERLEVGLADEGVRVIHAAPETVANAQPGGVFTRTVSYSPRILTITRKLAAARLARIVEQAGELAYEGVDVVHVFGGSAWSLGADTAAALGASLVLEVWRAGLVERARSIEPRGHRTLFIAPDPAIERSLAGGAESRPVRLAAWGTVAEPSLRPILAPDRAPSAMIVGSGRDAPAFAAALRGLADVASTRKDLLIFCDAVAARRSGLWALARKLNLLPQFSLIDELESRRDLLLQGDILIQPDAHGEARSTVLEAMATGMIVLAASDPMVSVLIDARTARLVPPAESAGWTRVVSDVLSNPDRARALAATAQEFVRTNRRASDHVRAVIQGYEWISAQRPTRTT
ncbi:hypothetical protein PHYC_00374 [Phycisphaerales bacterium]|nr:hypothetical protein PHYC_00374 [Phycisphaerales bacterium]